MNGEGHNEQQAREDISRTSERICPPPLSVEVVEVEMTEETRNLARIAYIQTDVDYAGIPPKQRSPYDYGGNLSAHFRDIETNHDECVSLLSNVGV
ncbi:Meiotically up-regulated protein 86 protein [Neofusicoccum ribis]|uniref:Meiotically up-regulated protein 86 protein n=1 Tax=Neofusicoccum ribis TaxID=45134 RepID=A0ABR3SFG6_9PEZI